MKDYSLLTESFSHLGEIRGYQTWPEWRRAVRQAGIFGVIDGDRDIACVLVRERFKRYYHGCAAWDGQVGYVLISRTYIKDGGRL